MKIIFRCPECMGRGYIKVWRPGKQAETTHMARCEQCSGFGQMSKPAEVPAR